MRIDLSHKSSRWHIQSRVGKERLESTSLQIIKSIGDNASITAPIGRVSVDELLPPIILGCIPCLLRTLLQRLPLLQRPSRLRSFLEFGSCSLLHGFSSPKLLARFPDSEGRVLSLQFSLVETTSWSCSKNPGSLRLVLCTFS